MNAVSLRWTIQAMLYRVVRLSGEKEFRS
jgi:hypothetical protein